jgi:hypothetical protein
MDSILMKTIQIAIDPELLHKIDNEDLNSYPY